MRKDKEKAFELRRQGKSYKMIGAELGIPLATLSGWFKHEPWSYEIKNKLSSQVSFSNPEKIKLMVKATREKWNRIHKEWQQEAIDEFPQLKNNILFLAGLMLYWGEGDRSLKNGLVRLANSDPGMIKIFYLFLSKNLQISPDKIHAWLLLYPDLIDAVQKNFWSMATGINPYQFKKSIVIRGKHPTKRLSYGVCTIFVHSRKLKEKIIKWLELYQVYLQTATLKITNN
jgi:hypothetical protein